MLKIKKSQLKNSPFFVVSFKEPARLLRRDEDWEAELRRLLNDLPQQRAAKAAALQKSSR